MSPAPEYPKIVEALRKPIIKGEFPPGAMMPSEGDLARRFGVARNTIRRALAELEREGLIVVVPGKGRVVSARGVPAGRTGDALLGYRRIAAELAEQIGRGTCPPGGRLLSEAAMARHYGVSRDTVRRALALLRAAGLVTVVHGKGWFVRGDVAGPSGT